MYIPLKTRIYIPLTADSSPFGNGNASIYIPLTADSQPPRTYLEYLPTPQDERQVRPGVSRGTCRKSWVVGRYSRYVLGGREVLKCPGVSGGTLGTSWGVGRYLTTRRSVRAPLWFRPRRAHRESPRASKTRPCRAWPRGALRAARRRRLS